MMEEREEFVWLRHPEAEAFVVERLEELVAALPPVRSLAARLLARTGSRLADWLDHLVLADGDATRGRLAELGFEPEEVPAEPGDVVYHHPGTVLPRILVRAGGGVAPGGAVAAAIGVEEVGDFLLAQHLTAPIEGTPMSPYRRAKVWQTDGRHLLVVERRGQWGFLPAEMPPDYPERYLRAFERWATRPRLFDDIRAGMEGALGLARSLAGEMGADTAAWIAFAAERAYWQQRNRAGQVQKARQDSLGLGWANHDHHTFRSSRETFPLLVEILETLGFRPRERFYAGAEAGWGAQVMDQPACRFTVFADVDLSPDEVGARFPRPHVQSPRPHVQSPRPHAQQPLPPRPELGTVGLWCALHGESMLGAGLHHLAARFDFDAATAGLAEWGIQMMHPFSDFSYLRQAFTQGERWEVDPERLERLVAAGQIDEAQRARFAASGQGAIGSHLENIQRRDGFKGFNQRTVSDIIRRTDPRAEFGAA